MIVNYQAFSSDSAVPSQLQPTDHPRTPNIRSILEQASTRLSRLPSMWNNMTPMLLPLSISATQEHTEMPKAAKIVVTSPIMPEKSVTRILGTPLVKRFQHSFVYSL
uniref:Uncharacterized protein n=1 Tax=Opuntia streptacantha TaxID=393608 RepID=A0A7C9CXV4_OPUST